MALLSGTHILQIIKLAQLAHCTRKSFVSVLFKSPSKDLFFVVFEHEKRLKAFKGFPVIWPFAVYLTNFQWEIGYAALVAKEGGHCNGSIGKKSPVMPIRINPSPAKYSLTYWMLQSEVLAWCSSLSNRLNFSRAVSSWSVSLSTMKEQQRETILTSWHWTVKYWS